MPLPRMLCMPRATSVSFNTHMRVFFVSASLFELMRRSFQLLITLSASLAGVSCAGSARMEPTEQASPVRALPAGADTAGSAKMVSENQDGQLGKCAAIASALLP